MSKKTLATLAVLLSAVSVLAADLSKEYPILSKYNIGRTPANRILKRGDRNIYAILHFGPNTFTDREWGYGDEDPKAFRPSAFDAEQIVKACKDGGITGIIIVCKHHDGLCMWPTKTTEHNITKTGFRDGKGDYVKEMADACRKHGLDVGFYVSPWDRNNPNYGKPEYLAIYREQLREVLSNYGPAFEVFLDGANGGDGYYGGARERRTIDHRTYYDWLNTWQIIRDLQPDAAIFSDVGPDVRWIGNEQGFAGKDSFGSFTPHSPRPAEGEAMPGFCKCEESPAGHADGVFFIPGDCDVALRPGWFYHEREDNAQKSVAQLVNIYLRSVGEGAYMDIGMAPDKRGLIHENDVKRLREFKVAVDSLFADKVFGQDLLLKENRGEIAFGEVRNLNFIRMQEDLAESAGEQVTEYYVEARQNGEWHRVLDGKAIGLNRLRAIRPVSCDAIRIVITKSHAAVKKLKISGYYAPDNLIGNRAQAQENTLKSGKDYQQLKPGKQDGNSVELEIPANISQIHGVVFTPMASIPAGTPDRCMLEIRQNGTWQKVAEVEFSNIRANPIPQVIPVSNAKADAIRLTAVHTLDGSRKIAFAEIGILGK